MAQAQLSQEMRKKINALHESMKKNPPQPIGNGIIVENPIEKLKIDSPSEEARQKWEREQGEKFQNLKVIKAGPECKQVKQGDRVFIDAKRIGSGRFIGTTEDFLVFDETEVVAFYPKGDENKNKKK